MPDIALHRGPYPSPPSPDSELILAPIRGCQPEDIPGLAWTKPDFSAVEHKIVRTFAVEGKRRPNGQYIPCAICSGEHPKFLDGAVLWSPDGYLRLIGHVCAAKPEHFGEARYRNLQRQRKQEELDDTALSWLSVHASTVKSLTAVIERLRSCALYIEAQQKVFFRDVDPLAILLVNRARQHGGSLSVVQKSQGSRLVVASGGAAQSLYEDVVVGTLIGAAFLIRPKHPRSRQLEGCLQALDLIPGGEGDEPILALIDRGGEGAINVAAGAALRAAQRALKMAKECVEAEQFIDPTNLAVLKTWGEDSRNPMQFTVRRFGQRIEFVMADKSRAALNMNWPKLPDLSVLRQVVAAGLQLDLLLPQSLG